jgi:aryl-alcohol dehydrogenase-like predicted oxidoreductase
MKRYSLKRRDFIKQSLTSAAALSTFSCKGIFTKNPTDSYDAKGLPRRTLGKTGVQVPLLVIGGGSRFCTVRDPEKSTEILNYALDNGLFYWDTAHDYVYENVVSEERYGAALKTRRKEVFLSTKVQNRTYEGALRHVEESLKRLQTDNLDLLQIHNVQSLEDIQKIGAPDGVYKALQKLKEEKVTRFIGYSGHLSAEAMMEAANRFDFDTMLIALNHYAERKGDFEKQAIPAASKREMGVLAMKVIRPRETVKSVTPEGLIRYALSLPYVSAAVVGIDSLDVLKKNIRLLKDFKPMKPEEMKDYTVKLASFFGDKSLPWMQSGYQDGYPA